MFKKDSLDPNHKKTLQLIQEKIRENGYPPTVREICKAVGVTSSATAHKYLTILEKKGYIHREKERSRAIKIIPQTNKVPVVGSVAAGEPMWALKDITEVIPIPEQLSGSEESFMVKVEGDSMIGDHILDGDYVMVTPQRNADNGDIVIALLNQEEVTVKRLYKKDDQITLQPSNPLYKPIDTKDAIILGKIIGILRRFNGGKYKDWIGTFYPENTDKKDMLKLYAQKFKVSEINSTYYRIPHPASFYYLQQKVPADFKFTVKANQEMTHSRALFFL